MAAAEAVMEAVIADPANDFNKGNLMHAIAACQNGATCILIATHLLSVVGYADHTQEMIQFFQRLSRLPIKGRRCFEEDFAFGYKVVVSGCVILIGFLHNANDICPFASVSIRRLAFGMARHIPWLRASLG
jgi:hypothetical protein